MKQLSNTPEMFTPSKKDKFIVIIDIMMATNNIPILNKTLFNKQYLNTAETVTKHKHHLKIQRFIQLNNYTCLVTRKGK